MKLKIIIIFLMLSGLTSYSQSERSYLLFVGPELDYKEAIGKTDTQGNKVGIWKYFRDDRSLVSVVPFENGKVNGNRRDFWETGNLYQSCDYVNNLKNGEQKIYFKNGLLYQNFYFKNDFKNGENKEFDINGDVYLIENYKNDELHGPYKSFYEGNLEEAGKYLEGKKEGTWTSYEEANVVQEVEYLNGLEDGLWKIRVVLAVRLNMSSI
jgi:antitoxin component YwqK of YwqJK toxin-antitoxin module